MKIIFWLVIYLLSISSLLLFLRCAGYYESELICIYEKEMSKVEYSLLEKIQSCKHNVCSLTYSDSLLGSLYRDSLYKEFLLDDFKLNKLSLSDDELSSVKKKIIPGFKERVSILNHFNYTFILIIVALGIFVGSLLNCL